MGFKDYIFDYSEGMRSLLRAIGIGRFKDWHGEDIKQPEIESDT